MATRTQNRQSDRSSSSSGSRSRSSSSSGSNRSIDSGRSSDKDRSAFSWGEGTGSLIAAGLAGAAIGFAANYGRKALMQGMEATIGDWDEILTAEHKLALGIFDKMLETDSSQTFKRKMLFMKLCHALDKHAHEEEMVVYPALRQANDGYEADELEVEHGHVKTYLFELEQMGVDAPNWLEKVRQFRALVAEHAAMEEQHVFPRFKESLDEEQNAKITSMVNKDGFWMA